jgi:aminopeptidase N
MTRSIARPRRAGLAALILLAGLTPSAVMAAGPTDGDVAPPGAPSAIQPGSVDRTSLALRATYRANVRLDWSDRSFDVDSAAVIMNTSGSPIDRVELNTAAARLGGLDLVGVEVDRTAVEATVQDQTIVVPLGGILPVGATTVVRVRYTATLRTSLSGSSWLFTKANGVANAYRWLPWVSRATPFSRPNHGDPFVTPTSPFVRVTLTTDRPLVVAMTGDRVAVSDDGRRQIFEARDVRDVTLTAAPDFETRATRVGDTTIRYYYRQGRASAVMGAAVAAFRGLQERLGDYPYPTFHVVQSAGGFGMESPQLIWIPVGVSPANLRYLITHETAHQWFYGLVGNDQARQPFADEAAADYVARDLLGLRRGSGCATRRLDLPIYDYSSACYYEQVYIQGGNVLHEARRSMGSTRFWSALREYVATHRHQLSDNRTLLTWLDERTPETLGRSIFAPRFPSIY